MIMFKKYCIDEEIPVILCLDDIHSKSTTVNLQQRSAKFALLGRFSIWFRLSLFPYIDYIEKLEELCLPSRESF